MVAPHAQIHLLFGQPEVGHDDVFLAFVLRREYKHERRQVARARQVKPCIAWPPAQFLKVYFALARVPFVHAHPSHGVFDPLVQAQLPEHHLVCRCFQRLSVSVAHLLNVDRVSQRRIRLIPVLLVVPVRVLRQSVHHGIESRVEFSPFQYVQRLLMHFVADRVSVRARRRQEKPERLGARVARSLRHDIIERSVRLSVQFVKHARRYVQAVFRRNLRRKHLIDAARRQVHHAFYARQQLYALHKRG